VPTAREDMDRSFEGTKDLPRRELYFII
jgi:hypothetical protein